MLKISVYIYIYILLVLLLFSFSSRAVEVPLKCSGSAIEVPCKYRGSDIEVPLDCNQPPAIATELLLLAPPLSTVGWSKTAHFTNL